MTCPKSPSELNLGLPPFEFETLNSARRGLSLFFQAMLIKRAFKKKQNILPHFLKLIRFQCKLASLGSSSLPAVIVLEKQVPSPLCSSGRLDSGRNNILGPDPAIQDSVGRLRHFLLRERERKRGINEVVIK